MGWHEVMRELEEKLEGTFKGTYRPLEGVPFFRVQYPPDQEREALRQFRQLADRLSRRGWKMELVRMSHLLNEALQDLLGCSPGRPAGTIEGAGAGKGPGGAASEAF